MRRRELPLLYKRRDDVLRAKLSPTTGFADALSCASASARAFRLERRSELIAAVFAAEDEVGEASEIVLGGEREGAAILV